MYKRMAIHCTNFFINKNIVDIEKRDIHIYGFEILISSLFYLLYFLVLSVISQTLLPSICFFLGLFIIRKVAGGHHSKSYKSCHILFSINHILFIALYYIVPQKSYSYVVSLILFVAVLSLWFIAPVDHINKPFIKNEYKKYKILSIIYGFLLALLITFLLTNNIYAHKHLFSFTIGSLSAVSSLLIGKITRIKERKHYEKNAS